MCIYIYIYTHNVYVYIYIYIYIYTICIMFFADVKESIGKKRTHVREMLEVRGKSRIINRVEE